MTTEYIETRMVLLDDLMPYPGNARRGDRDSLVESLDTNGQYRSLIVRDMPDGSLVVLCGNNTLEALEARGDTEARCEIVTCDDATALRVNLVDNKANDRAVYDEEARAALLLLLDGAVTGTGYTEDEADSILARYEEPEILTVEEPTVAYNDDAEEREARKRNHGGDDSKTFESRGVRDVFLALPNAEADELGRLIMALRESWGPLDQGTVLLRAARVARRALAGGHDEEVMDDILHGGAADAVYSPESAEENPGG